jgi:DivIVA domain-containing protein
MAESDRRRVITSTPHLTPEQISQRTFATSFRGYSEADVRAFLERISGELVVARDREAELLSVIDDLEGQLRAPRPLNEPELLDALGAETTRLLRSAREAADEIRAKGEERGARILDEARVEADRVLAEAEERARLRTEESEEHAALLVSEAEARAAEVHTESERHAAAEQQRVERESEEQIEAALQQGREMLEEAKSTRERVLADLFRRRALLQAQIDELRAGRDSLLDAYRVVKRSFLDATNALAQVEARAAEERARGGDAEPSDELAEELRAATGDVEPSLVEASAAAAAGDGTDTSLADVDSLFARLRAGQEAEVERTPEPEEPRVSEEPAASPPADIVGEAPVAEEDTKPEPAPSSMPDTTSADEWRAKRSAVLDPLISSITKKAKRAAQDDQNALLDAVRRHKGRPTSEQVLVAEPDLLASWIELVHDAIDQAYGAGRAAVGVDVVPADTTMAREAAETIVLPLRERIATAIDAGEEGDTSGLVERIGARFREWKNQSLEELLVDELSGAWSRGVYDASPDGAVFRWIPLVEGRCADCDDNGLEPTAKGSSFPTGQLHPPAHPGCRCLLAPADT